MRSILTALVIGLMAMFIIPAQAKDVVFQYLCYDLADAESWKVGLDADDENTIRTLFADPRSSCFTIRPGPVFGSIPNDTAYLERFNVVMVTWRNVEVMIVTEKVVSKLRALEGRGDQTVFSVLPRTRNDQVFPKDDCIVTMECPFVAKPTPPPIPET